MTVELTQEDLINLLYGTRGPHYYTSRYDSYGKLAGGPAEHWVWNRVKLKSITEEELWALYQDLKSFNNKS